MAKTTIGWTATRLPDGTMEPGYTFNPWIGCAKVSPGCANCYAEDMMDKRYGRVKWGMDGTRSKTSEANWKKPFAWNRKAKSEGVRYKVFCSSLADVFEGGIFANGNIIHGLTKWRSGLFSLISMTPYLTWLLLTKRPHNINDMVRNSTEFEPEHWFSGNPHVLTGTSAENQEWFDKRIGHITNVPSAVRFLSLEPLLGPIDFGDKLNQGLGIQWVIVGGESGRNARPMHPDWVRSIRDQCLEAGVPFFFKQWGKHNYFGDKVGKGKAGNIIDGRKWEQFPPSLTSKGRQ